MQGQRAQRSTNLTKGAIASGGRLNVVSQIVAVSIVLLLSANLSSPVQGLTLPSTPVSSSLITSRVEARIQDVLDALPADIAEAWHRETGQDLHNAVNLAPLLLAQLQDRLAANPPQTLEDSALLLAAISQSAANEFVGRDGDDLIRVEPQPLPGERTCFASLDKDINTVLDIVCDVIAFALLQANLAVDTAVLVALTVLAAVVVVLDVVVSAVESALPAPTCPPTCAPPQTVQTAPAFRRLGQMEYVINSTVPADPHDLDNDGVSDAWDTVNLPSEAGQVTQAADVLQLLDGLPNFGFVLIVNPTLQEARLVAANPFDAVNEAIAPQPVLDAVAALDRIESLQGRELRNALAPLLPEGSKVHYTSVATETASDIPLLWTKALPADGTWLVLSTDPTRALSLQLAGMVAPMASRALSHFSTNQTDERWSFINLHEGTSFCYDPTTRFVGSPCLGAPAPGWLRAYSGYAASALTALQEGLAAGVVPVTTVPPPIYESGPNEATRSLPDPTTPSLPKRFEILSLPIGDLPVEWRATGNSNRIMPVGHGVDYLIPGTQSMSLMQQVTADSMTGPVHLSPQRLFKFQAIYDSTPALPRNITHLQLRIEDLDGNTGPQAFLVDGKALHELLDIQTGDEFKLDIDGPHADGFNAVQRDVNGDGITDLLFNVPHFSQPWIDVTNSNTAVNFFDVELATATSGWLSGASNTVYRYSNGVLEAKPLPGLSGYHATSALHVVSDTEFYVAVGCSDTATEKGRIAHYVSGAYVTPFKQLPDCYTPGALWMSSDGLLGYATGLGKLYQYKNGAWTALPGSPFTCAALDLKLDASGRGLVSTNDYSECGGVGMYYFDGAANPPTFTARSNADQVQPVRVEGPTGTWAVSGATVVQWNDGTGKWTNSAESYPAAYYRSVAQAGSIDEHWFVGAANADQSGGGKIVKRSSGTWSVHALDHAVSTLTDIDMYSDKAGLAVGAYGALVKYQPFTPPVVAGTISSTTGNTNTVFNVDGTGTHYANGDQVLQQWMWGDTASSSGNTASHRYNTPGSYVVQHLTYEQGAWVARQSWTVTVTAAAQSIGVPFSGTFTPTEQDKVPTAPERSQHFQITGTGGPIAIQLTETGSLTPHDYLRVHFATGGTAGIDGTGTPWPYTDARLGRSAGQYVVGGSLANGQVLDIEVRSWLYEDANIKNQDGSRSNSWGTVGFTLAASTPSSLPYPTPTLTSGTMLPLVQFSVSAPHTVSNYRTTVYVDWGDQSGYWQSPYAVQGTQYSLSHTYAPGSYTVWIVSADEVDQSRSVYIPITVHALPTAVTNGATMTAVGGTLTGAITGLGGAPSVSAYYQLYLGTTLVQTSPTYVLTSTGALPSWAVSGLSGGKSYTYRIVASSDVGSIQTAYAAAATAAPLSIKPAIQSNPTVNLGTASTLSFKANGFHARPVAYYMRWDTYGSEVRYPTTGFVPWDQVVTASRTFPFAGSHYAEVRIEDDLLARSSATAATVVVQGNAPVTNLASSSTQSSATLSATLSNVGYSPVNLRFCIDDPSLAQTTCNTWTSATAGNSYSWTPTVNAAKTYWGHVELDAGDGQTWTSGTVKVRVNQAPTLKLETLPTTVSHLGSLRFSVTYTDEEGDLPRNQAGALQNPQLTVNGTTYTMHYESGSSATGATYSYIVQASKLQQGLSVVPVYSTWDQFQRQVVRTGNATYIAKEAHTFIDFEDQAAGSLPNGLQVWGEPNYWHVEDTASMPERIARGHHGKVAWYGNPQRGNYEGDGYNSPHGVLSTGVLDLRLAIDPVLSYSSYYETESLGLTEDKKTVYISSRDPASSTWSFWTNVQSVGGYDGGYGAWRTQHIDLSAYEGKLVRLHFYFQANEDSNHYLGWMIDDIVLGHDQDRDQLPDRLERIRSDVQVTNNPVVVEVPNGGAATGYVRRLDRPHASSLYLDAIVSAPNLSKVKVVLGAQDALTGTKTSTILYGAAPLGSCGASPPDFIGPAPAGSAVTVQSDGLVIHVDAGSCGLDVPSKADWFLEVTDKQTGDALTYIESLRAVSSGRTRMDFADTDADEIADGIEVKYLHDPLGADLDRDTLPAIVDPDETVPSWAPAIRLASGASGDFQNRVELSLLDTMAPIVNLRVAGQVSATGSVRDYSLTSTKSGWRFETDQFGTLPDVIRVIWRDVYGNTGTLDVEMSSVGSYQPKRTSFHATDFATGISANFEQSISATSPIMSLVIGAADVVGAGWEARGVVLVATALAAGVIHEFSGVQPMGTAVETAVATYTYVTDSQESKTQSRSCSTTSCIRYTDAQLAGLATATMTVAELQYAIQFHQHEFPEPGGGTRNLWDYGTGLVVFITVIEQGERIITKAWEWVYPISLNVAEATPEYFLKLERTFQQAWSDTVYEAAADSLLLFRYLRNIDCALFVPVTITSMSDGLKLDTEQAFAVPKCVHDAWVYALKSMEDATKYAVNQGFIDASIGMGMNQYLKNRAKNGDFGGGNVFWYWDESEIPAQKADCTKSSSTWVHPYIRRCNDYRLQSFMEVVDWETMDVPEDYGDTYIDVPDYLGITEIDWAPTSNPYYRDAFSSKGAVVPFQSLVAGSQSLVGWVMDELADQIPTPELGEADAEVRAAYLITDLTGSSGAVDYRRMPAP